MNKEFNCPVEATISLIGGKQVGHIVSSDGKNAPLQ